MRLVAGGQVLGHGHVGAKQVRERHRFSGHQPGQGANHGFQGIKQSLEIGLDFFRQFLFILQRQPQPFEPGRRARAAQKLDLKGPDPVPERARLHSPRRQRVLERRQQRNRRQAIGGHPRSQAQERPGRGLGQGQPGGIVDLDAPTGELRCHPAGQAPVRRHQGGGLFLIFEGAAHDQRDDGGLFPGAGAVDAGNSRHRRLDVLGLKAWRIEAGRC